MRAVSVVRRRAGGARTGHAGTLDPLATGVLVLALGRATKIIDRLMNTTKRYRTAIDFNAFSSTDDLEGEIEPVSIVAPPTRGAVEEALAGFRGRIMQRPPQFSAVKVGGRRAYKMARQGQSVAVEPRPVTVHALVLCEYAWPRAVIEIHCGKGFYVRSLARELGAALGTGGYCRSIRRMAVGPFDLNSARTLEQLPDQIDQGDLIEIEEALQLVADDQREETG